MAEGRKRSMALPEIKSIRSEQFCGAPKTWKSRSLFGKTWDTTAK
jgi:hypothetical protein